MTVDNWFDFVSVNCRIYWMNPLQYAQKAILVNEFTGGVLSRAFCLQ